MNLEEIKTKLLTFLKHCQLPTGSIIKEISLFGSITNNENTISSDWDVLIIHSASSISEYTNLIRFTSDFTKEANRKGLLIDIFLCHSYALAFVNKHLYVYLNSTLRNKTIIYKNTNRSVSKIKRQGTNRKIVLANLFLLLEQLHKIIPTVLHEQRKKNFKTTSYAFKHLCYLLPKYLSINNLVAKGLASISNELPINTLKLDLRYLKLIFKLAAETNITKLNFTELFHVELANFYFIKMKYSRHFGRVATKELEELIISGLKIIFKILMQEKRNPNKFLQKDLQYLTNASLNRTIKKRNLLKEYCILMKSCDLLITKLSP